MFWQRLNNEKNPLHSHRIYPEYLTGHLARITYYYLCVGAAVVLQLAVNGKYVRAKVN